ncbi:hypothetical protein [Fulvivirga ligni]|uniref:hypothetical protein n=1 Tax=Fulvivirga ligni TaxID=2904246 RepID=UPI001F3CDE05|nr:hypothetical protein [Fulvivirga ligni]UII19337.1 hypothetical protein LVD16_15955 [Fulvivirga ligni]
MKPTPETSVKSLSAKLAVIPKSRFTAVAVVLLSLLIGLGTVYYFHIQKEQEAYIDYRFHRLSSMADKWEKMVGNYERSVKAGYKPFLNNKDTAKIERQAEMSPMANFPVEASAQNLYWKKIFDEFIIVKDDAPQYQSFKSQISIGKTIPNDSALSVLGDLKEVKVRGQMYYAFEHHFTIKFKNETQPWMMVGLVNQHSFQSATKRLDIWVLLILVALLCLIILGFPLIKLIFISEIERLKRSDVVLAGISVVLGAPIIVTLFLNGFYYINQYYFGVSGSLSDLANKIETNFDKDIDNELTLLDSYDSNEQFIAIDTVRKKYTGIFKNISHIHPTDGLIDQVENFPLNQQVTTKNSNLSHREYFKAYQNKEFWHREIDGKSYDYVVRPVISLEQNAEESVFVLPGRNELETPDHKHEYPLVASVELPSVHSAVLAPGYSFMIIDQDGLVWHHFEKGRSSLEYFLEETRDHQLLKASITGNIEAEHLINYQGKNYLMRIIPMKSKPLFVVTMYDVEFLRYRISEILSLGSIAIIIAFIVTGIFTVITILRHNQYNAHKYKLFSFYFLEPRLSKKHDYILITLIFIFFMLILAAFAFFGGGLKPSAVFVGNMLLMVWGYCIVYQILVPGEHFTKFLLLIVIALINYFTEHSIKIIVIQLIFLVTLGVVTVFKDRLLQWIERAVVHIPWGRYQNCYINFLFVWLIFTSIFPAFNYFIKARQIEDIIWMKYAQVQMAHAYNDKLLNLEAKEISNFDYVNNGIYFVNKDNSFRGAGWTDLDSGAVKSKFRSMLFKYRPVYGSLTAETQPFVFLGADNAAWKWKENGNELLFRYKMKVPKDFTNDFSDSTYLYMTSIIPGIHPLKGSSSQMTFGFIILGCALLLALHFLITFFVQRIFGISLLQHLKRNIDSNRNVNIRSKNILLIGVTYAGKHLLCDHLVNGKKRAELSLLKLEDAAVDDVLNINLLMKGDGATDWKDYDVFIIKNFEYGYQSLLLNGLKIKLLKELIDERKRIIIISSIYPKQILDFYNAQLKTSEKQEELIHQRATWKYLLGSFSEIIKPLNNNVKKVISAFNEVDLNLTGWERKEALKKLTQELGCGNFLPTLTRPVLEMSLKSNQIDDNQLIISANSLAFGYYNSIWNSLEQREKFLVYDIAVDGFVNLKNDKALYSLMRKGIVKFEDRPRLFNDSFRNHIMSSVRKKEANEMAQKIKEQGSWASVKVILYIVIAAIAGFLFIGEPSFVEDFSTFLSILAGIATVMPLVSGMLGGKVE